MSTTRRTAALVLVGLAACTDGPAPAAPHPADIVRVVLTVPTAELTWIGAQATLTAAAVDAGGAAVPATIVWSSSDPSIATATDRGLVTALAPGAVRIRAAAGSHAAEAILRVRVEPVTAVAVGGDGQQSVAGQRFTAPLVAEFRDGGGTPIGGLRVRWTVEAGAGRLEGVDTVTDYRGRVAALWRAGLEGDQRVRAGVDSIAVSFSGRSIGGDASFDLVGLSPDTLTERAEAVLSGTGFPADAGLLVLVDGVPAELLSADAEAIRIRVPSSDCLPARTARVTVVGAGGAASLGTVVRPAAAVRFAIGQGAVLGDDGCLRVAPESGAEYLIGVLSRAGPATLTPVRIETRTGLELDAAAGLPDGFPLSPPTRPMSARPVSPARQGPVVRPASDAEAEARLWTENRRRLAGVLVRPAAGPASAAREARTVGDVLALFQGIQGCTGRDRLDGVVRHAGQHAIWIEDRSLAAGFSDAEWADLDATFDRLIEPTLTEYFGAFGDVDGNGRILIVMSPGVNRTGLLGYVWSGDLLGPVGCPDSNVGEVFYGIAPDPEGRYGSVRSRQSVLDLYPSLIAHEVAHIAQFANLRASRARWELEGPATLAEQLVGMRARGDGPLSDLGYAGWSAGGAWYHDWAADMAIYWGYRDPYTRVPAAPDQCSWMGTAADGNAGPCFAGRAIYGVPAMLLRYVLDRYGPAYPEGAAGLLRAFTATTHAGTRGLAELAGIPETVLLAEFYAALWADGRIGDWLTSWNLRDVFRNLAGTARLEPPVIDQIDASREVQVRGGSNAYTLWRPAGEGSRAIRIRPLGGEPSDQTAYWVMRVR